MNNNKPSRSIFLVKILIVVLLLVIIGTMTMYNNKQYIYSKLEDDHIDTSTTEISKDDNDSINTSSPIFGYSSKYTIKNVENILQNPELPTGCEVTSLAIVLNYYDIGIAKTVLADTYLPKCNIGEGTAYDYFIGSPRGSNAYGCYAPVIVKTTENYFEDYNIDNYKVADLSGTEFNELFNYVDDDIPVIVWTTIGLEESYESTSWKIDNKSFTWRANEHCVVLYGYDIDENIVYISDPLEGNIEYNLDTFETRYNELYKQAVIIRKD